MPHRYVIGILKNIHDRFAAILKVTDKETHSRILSDEKILEKIHVHWIVYIPALIAIVVSISAFSLLLLYSSVISAKIGIPNNVTIISIMLIFSFIFTAILSNLMYTWYNFYLLTDHRLIHVHLEKNFTYQAEEFFLARIKYIDSRRLGLFSMLLNYGEVDIDLDIGNGGYDCIMKRVPHPTQITKKMNNLIERKYGSVQSHQLGTTY